LIHDTEQALDEAKVKYTSHYVSLPKFEQYDPKYAQLNPRCVIPTLVVDGRVTTDAANIIAYIDDNYMGVPKKFLGFFLDEGKSLYPTEPKEQDLVTHFSDLGESLFLGPLTFAKLPGVEHVDVTNGATNAAYEPKRRAKKMQMVKDLIKKNSDNEYLQRVYRSKLHLEDKMDKIFANEKNIIEIVEATKRAFDELAVQLKNGPFYNEGWLCSKDFSIADLIWGIVIFRLKRLKIGNELLWKNHPVVNSYFDALSTRDSFQSGIIDWQKKCMKEMNKMRKK